MRFPISFLLACSISGAALAHDFDSVPDIGALGEAERGQRCLALSVFLSSELRLETIKFDFEYVSGPGREAGQRSVMHLQDIYTFHLTRVAAHLVEADGPTPEDQDIGARVMEKVAPESELYQQALAVTDAADVEGRFPLRDAVQARQLLSHDLMSCFSEYAITELIK